MSTPFDDETASDPEPTDTNDAERETEGQKSETDQDQDGMSGDAEISPTPGGPNDPAGGDS